MANVTGGLLGLHNAYKAGWDNSLPYEHLVCKDIGALMGNRHVRTVGLKIETVHCTVP